MLAMRSASSSATRFLRPHMRQHTSAMPPRRMAPPTPPTTPPMMLLLLLLRPPPPPPPFEAPSCGNADVVSTTEPVTEVSVVKPVLVNSRGLPSLVVVMVTVKGRVEVPLRALVVVRGVGVFDVDGVSSLDGVFEVDWSVLRGVEASGVVLGVDEGAGLLVVVVSSFDGGDEVRLVSGAGVLEGVDSSSVDVDSGAGVVLPVPWACRFLPLCR